MTAKSLRNASLATLTVRLSASWRARFDRVGIVLSVVCGIHCVLTPLLIMFFPMMDGYISDAVFHRLMLVLIVPVASLLLIRWQTSHEALPVILGAVGLVLLGAAAFLPESLLPGYLDHSITIGGALCLACAHVLNLRHGCACCPPDISENHV